MSVFATTAATIAGVERGTAAGAAVEHRANVFEMTQTAEDAVLRPRETGAFPHDLRAALAARIARRSGDDALGAHFAQGAGDHSAIADPATADPELAGVVAFVDKAAHRPRDIATEDIAKLRAEGMADPDVVRLCELVAFVAYQLRVVAGLRLMRGAS